MKTNTAAKYTLELIGDALTEEYENTFENLSDAYYEVDNEEAQLEIEADFDILYHTSQRVPKILNTLKRMAEQEDDVEPLTRDEMEQVCYALLLFDDEEHVKVYGPKTKKNRARELSDVLREVDASKLFNALHGVSRDTLIDKGYRKVLKEAITSQMIEVEADGFITQYVTGMKF